MSDEEQVIKHKITKRVMIPKIIYKTHPDGSRRVRRDKKKRKQDNKGA